MNKTRELRKAFLANLIVGLRVVWPILSLITVSIGVLGIIIGALEGWSMSESIYFAFVTGLTVGYGDLVPKSLLTRVLAILVGFCGILLTSLVAAVAVKALGATVQESNK
jgi:hypothetical protein